MKEHVVICKRSRDDGIYHLPRALNVGPPRKTLNGTMPFDDYADKLGAPQFAWSLCGVQGGVFVLGPIFDHRDPCANCKRIEEENHANSNSKVDDHSEQT